MRIGEGGQEFAIFSGCLLCMAPRGWKSISFITLNQKWGVKVVKVGVQFFLNWRFASNNLLSPLSHSGLSACYVSKQIKLSSHEHLSAICVANKFYSHPTVKDRILIIQQYCSLYEIYSNKNTPTQISYNSKLFNSKHLGWTPCVSHLSSPDLYLCLFSPGNIKKPWHIYHCWN